MFLISKDYWQIKKTKKKGQGVFARKEIKAGTVIGDYLGEIINIAEYDLGKDKHGLYLMYYSDEASIYPDLTKPGLHLFNHSCNPNCWMYEHRGHTLFFALCNIEPGEELTISYLLSPKDDICNPCTHNCHCGTKFCTVTMHLSEEKYKLWQEFQKKRKKKTKKAKVVFGENLKILKHYPKSIPIGPIYAIMTSYG